LLWSRSETFAAVESKWIPLVENANPRAPIIVVGNKYDRVEVAEPAELELRQQMRPLMLKYRVRRAALSGALLVLVADSLRANFSLSLSPAGDAANRGVPAMQCQAQPRHHDHL